MLKGSERFRNPESATRLELCSYFDLPNLE